MTKDFIHGNIKSSLTSFAIPMMLTLLLQELYGVTDLLVVGRFAHVADMSAVTVGSQIMMCLTFIVFGLTTGTTVLLGQTYGMGDKRRLSTILGSSILLFAVLSAIFTVAGLFNVNSIVSLMKSPAEAVIPTRAYTNICMSGFLFIVGYNVCGAVLRGLGDSKTPTIFVAIAAGINIVLDLLFVAGFGWGAAGAAFATVIAQAGSLLFAIIYLRRHGLGFKFYVRDIRFEWKTIRDTVVIGTPIAVQNIFVGLSFMILTLVINRLGVAASASVGVVDKLVNFLMIPSIAYSASVATMSAQNFGAGQFRRAKEGLWTGMRIAFMIACVTFVLCQFFGAFFCSLITSNPAVIVLAKEMLRSYSADCMLVSFVFTMNGYFNAGGHSLFSLLHAIVSTCCARVPLTIFLASVPNITMFAFGTVAPASTLVSVIMCAIYYVYITRNNKIKIIAAGVPDHA